MNIVKRRKRESDLDFIGFGLFIYATNMNIFLRLHLVSGSAFETLRNLLIDKHITTDGIKVILLLFQLKVKIDFRSCFDDFLVNSLASNSFLSSVVPLREVFNGDLFK